MKTQTVVPLQNLTEDILSALIARDKVRKLGGSPSTRPHEFVAFFNESSKVPKGRTDKETVKLEKQKKEEIQKYVKENFGVTNQDGVLTGVIVD